MDAISNVVDTIREQMETNARLLAVAHDAYANEAMESVQWERRGFLGRLTKRAA